MTRLNRRQLLHSGTALAVSLGGASLIDLYQHSTTQIDDESESKGTSTNSSTASESERASKGKTMRLKYLEIVTTDVDTLCKQYSTIHGITFGKPDQSLGNARTAKLNGSLIGIRQPLRNDEAPVIRPYTLVEDLEKAVAAAKNAGAEIAIPKMEIPGHGTIAIFIQGGIESGLWQE